jgi:hypothetical protein
MLLDEEIRMAVLVWLSDESEGALPWTGFFILPFQDC